MTVACIRAAMVRGVSGESALATICHDPATMRAAARTGSRSTTVTR
jgi:hypothetical protein